MYVYAVSARLLIQAALLSGEGPVFELSPVPSVDALAISPDGKTLAIATNIGDVQIWDVPRKRELGRIRAERAIERVEIIWFADDSTLRVTRPSWPQPTGDADMVVTTWNAKQIALKSTGMNRGWPVYSVYGRRPLALPADPKKILMQHRQNGRVAVEVLDAVSGETKALTELTSKLHIGALSRDGRVACLCTSDRMLLVWDLVNAKKIAEKQLDYLPDFVHLSPDGKHLVYRHEQANRFIVRDWATDDSHVIWALGPVFFPGDANTVAAVVVDRLDEKRFIGFFDLATKREVRSLLITTQDSGDNLPSPVAYSKDGRWLAECRLGPDQRTRHVRVWQLPGAK